MISAIGKILNLEQWLVFEAYEAEHVKVRETQYIEIKEALKKNITLISEEVLLLSEQTHASVQQLIEYGHKVKEQIAMRAKLSLQSRMIAEDGQEHMQILADKIKSLIIFMKNVEENIVLLNQSFPSITEFVN
ncbi:hypothetical protein [Peribacillus muralis]|uniref:hypothetical protein n=1 Tax=Peribacillus muralis TaxID=264697 RepID=UPI003CFBD81E